jgi:hypothetical protein
MNARVGFPLDLAESLPTMFSYCFSRCRPGADQHHRSPRGLAHPVELLTRASMRLVAWTATATLTAKTALGVHDLGRTRPSLIRVDRVGAQQALGVVADAVAIRVPGAGIGSAQVLGVVVDRV